MASICTAIVELLIECKSIMTDSNRRSEQFRAILNLPKNVSERMTCGREVYLVLVFTLASTSSPILAPCSAPTVMAGI